MRETVLAVLATLVIAGMGRGAPGPHLPWSHRGPKRRRAERIYESGSGTLRWTDVHDLIEISRRRNIPMILPRLIRASGVCFTPTDQPAETLRRARASEAVTDAVLSSLQKPCPPPRGIVVLYLIGQNRRGDFHRVYTPKPHYPAAARRRWVQGRVYVLLVVGTSGHVKDVKEVSPPLGSGIDESVVSTVRTWRFTPPQWRDRPANSISWPPSGFAGCVSKARGPASLNRWNAGRRPSQPTSDDSA